MPRTKKNPDAETFDFKMNPEKELAKTTLSNYKNALNRLTEYSVIENDSDDSKPIIKTKEDLLSNPNYVLALINKYIDKRLTKSTTLASIFYITGRLTEDHAYVKVFRELYYTPSYLASQAEKTKLIESAKDV